MTSFALHDLTISTDSIPSMSTNFGAFESGCEHFGKVLLSENAGQPAHLTLFTDLACQAEHFTHEVDRSRAVARLFRQLGKMPGNEFSRRCLTVLGNRLDWGLKGTAVHCLRELSKQPVMLALWLNNWSSISSLSPAKQAVIAVALAKNTHHNADAVLLHDQCRELAWLSGNTERHPVTVYMSMIGKTFVAEYLADEVFLQNASESYRQLGVTPHALWRHAVLKLHHHINMQQPFERDLFDNLRLALRLIGNAVPRYASNEEVADKLVEGICMLAVDIARLGNLEFMYQDSLLQIMRQIRLTKVNKGRKTLMKTLSGLSSEAYVFSELSQYAKDLLTVEERVQICTGSFIAGQKMDKSILLDVFSEALTNVLKHQAIA